MNIHRALQRNVVALPFYVRRLICLDAEPCEDLLPYEHEDQNPDHQQSLYEGVFVAEPPPLCPMGMNACVELLCTAIHFLKFLANRLGSLKNFLFPLHGCASCFSCLFVLRSLICIIILCGFKFCLGSCSLCFFSRLFGLQQCVHFLSEGIGLLNEFIHVGPQLRIKITCLLKLVALALQLSSNSLELVHLLVDNIEVPFEFTQHCELLFLLRQLLLQLLQLPLPIVQATLVLRNEVIYGVPGCCLRVLGNSCVDHFAVGINCLLQLPDSLIDLSQLLFQLLQLICLRVRSSYRWGRTWHSATGLWRRCGCRRCPSAVCSFDHHLLSRHFSTLPSCPKCNVSLDVFNLNLCRINLVDQIADWIINRLHLLCL
mmetsp:Transcript_36915/g.85153  ORF Transcript_36915/g.85153 Transcript_36915/m.85153 type:complete len:372 (+) Transcript_36915:1171-2286(+)